MRAPFKLLLVVALSVFSCLKTHSPPLLIIPEDIALCGTVKLPSGCDPQVDTLISVGLALIHHMTFERAEEIFQKVSEHYPQCFWGPWGVAMSYIHPLWPDVPSQQRLEQGYALARSALSLASTDQQQQYGNALMSYYSHLDGDEKNRLKNYHEGWGSVYQSYPEDPEAKAFYALTMLANARPDDTTFATQLQAGALSEEILEEIPDHPAGFHYAIHAYDHPELGNKALEVARKYSDIAPEIPHALHMPTHIFTRLGLWEESINWNQRSADAAIKIRFDGKVSNHYFHAVDYLVYAQLQMAQDQQAWAAIKATRAVPEPYQIDAAIAYSLAAIDARYTVELKDWSAAANLKVRDPEHFPWDSYPQFEALTHFAKGLGAAREGLMEQAQASWNKLHELRQAIEQVKQSQYWAHQVEIQQLGVQSWMHLPENPKLALELMHEAANLEASVRLHGVSPGYIIPAQELLADMYLELGQPQKALEYYQNTLANAPNKLNALYGAGVSAELIGDLENSQHYYSRVVELANPQASRVMIDESREKLKSVL